MRTAICETFPEPNRRLLQRYLVSLIYEVFYFVFCVIPNFGAG